MSVSLHDKCCLVVGGGSGIGLSTAQMLAAEGARVAIAGRREEVLRSAAASCRGPHAVLHHGVDVADLDSVRALVRWTERELGRIDILVNSAGVNVPRRSMAELSPADWRKLIDINATGAFYLLHCALPGMRERGDGLVVNVSSISGKRAAPLGGVGYNAAKFAMSALGISAGAEEAAHGVRVTNIYPGEVDTPILEHRPQPVTDEHRARILKPEDVAETILMVARLPARASVPELVIKPTWQTYV